MGIASGIRWKRVGALAGGTLGACAALALLAGLASGQRPPELPADVGVEALAAAPARPHPQRPEHLDGRPRAAERGASRSHARPHPAVSLHPGHAPGRHGPGPAPAVEPPASATPAPTAPPPPPPSPPPTAPPSSAPPPPPPAPAPAQAAPGQIQREFGFEH